MAVRRADRALVLHPADDRRRAVDADHLAPRRLLVAAEVLRREREGRDALGGDLAVPQRRAGHLTELLGRALLRAAPLDPEPPQPDRVDPVPVAGGHPDLPAS